MTRWHAFLLLLFALVAFPTLGHATTYQDALQACQQVAAQRHAYDIGDGYPPGAYQFDCRVGTDVNGSNYVDLWDNKGGRSSLGYVQRFGFDGPLPPDDSCSKISPYSGAFSGKLSLGSPMCQKQPDGSGCGMTFKPDQDPFLNRDGTKWASHGTYSPTGQKCSPGDIGGDPNNAPPPPPAPTRSCGDVSCHDTSNNTTCADSAGGSNCLTAPQINNGQGGSCSTLGENTICGGTPTAPTPPAPPASPISDPDREIIGTDHYTYSSPTGGNYTTTITTYGAGQAPASSGQKPGDDGPAPASSSGSGQKGDGTTASGGGDCNSPPVVNGSGGLNAVAYQAWKTRCAVEGNKLGTGTPNTLGDLYTPSTDTTESVVADFQAKVQQTPVAGAVTGFFNVGSVGGSCPVWTLAASEWLPAMTFDFYCRPELSDLLDMARVLVLIACAYAAFQIAMGDS